jgi:hypothetical protein
MRTNPVQEFSGTPKTAASICCIAYQEFVVSKDPEIAGQGNRGFGELGYSVFVSGAVRSSLPLYAMAKGSEL